MKSVRAVGIVLGVWIVAIFAGLLAAEELRVPAFTAYILPDAHGARINDTPVTADFGTFHIAQVGYQRLTLASRNEKGRPFGDLDALKLDGPAIAGAHLSLKERRNAASVHLSYQAPENQNIAEFYCEVTAVEDPTARFFMACGWHRGYFGMQVNSPTERRIIFSVWDSGGEGVDRNQVADENRVKLLGKGAGVYSGDFGNEGPGGHSGVLDSLPFVR